MEHDELIKALHIHSVALERNTRGTMEFMEIQRVLAKTIPTTNVWGMYTFNQGGDATMVAQWRQLLPRNMRRKRTTLFSLNQTHQGR